MSTDIEMLVWVAGLTAIMWLPYIAAHVLNVGLIPALTYAADDTPPPKWAARAKRAHYNAIENLVPFAVVVIVADMIGAANEATAVAAVTYLVARIAHYFLYMANVPFGRTITFTVGWLAILCIFYHVVTAGPAA